MRNRVAICQQPPARLLLKCLRDREDDVLPVPVRVGHPAPVRHPRLYFHRRQAEPGHRASRTSGSGGRTVDLLLVRGEIEMQVTGVAGTAAHRRHPDACTH